MNSYIHSMYIFVHSVGLWCLPTKLRPSHHHHFGGCCCSLLLLCVYVSVPYSKSGVPFNFSSHFSPIRASCVWTSTARARASHNNKRLFTCVRFYFDWNFQQHLIWLLILFKPDKLRWFTSWTNNHRHALIIYVWSANVERACAFCCRLLMDIAALNNTTDARIYGWLLLLSGILFISFLANYNIQPSRGHITHTPHTHTVRKSALRTGDAYR